MVSGLLYLKWLIPTETKKALTHMFGRIFPKRSMGTCL